MYTFLRICNVHRESRLETANSLNEKGGGPSLSGELSRGTLARAGQKFGSFGNVRFKPCLQLLPFLR